MGSVGPVRPKFALFFDSLKQRVIAIFHVSPNLKHFRSPGIDSKESILSAYVALRASTSNRVFVPVARLEINSWAP
jgi:hypothetical protein